MDLLKDSNYFFNIHSKNNCLSINSLFSNKLNQQEFAKNLLPDELKEFEIVMSELKKFGLLKEEFPSGPMIHINQSS
jgi:hypothetical protein